MRQSYGDNQDVSAKLAVHMEHKQSTADAYYNLNTKMATSVQAVNKIEEVVTSSMYKH